MYLVKCMVVELIVVDIEFVVLYGWVVYGVNVCWLYVE